MLCDLIKTNCTGKENPQGQAVCVLRNRYSLFQKEGGEGGRGGEEMMGRICLPGEKRCQNAPSISPFHSALNALCQETFNNMIKS